jgi:hypothetical protein
MIRPRHAGVALLASALVLTGGAASAAQKTTKDKHGDAGATADVTRVVVKNGEKTLTVRAKLAKASAGRSHLVVTLAPTVEGGATYVARTVQAAHGKKVGATLESSAAIVDPIVDPIDDPVVDPVVDPAVDPLVDPLAPTVAPALVECAGIKASVSSGRRGQVSVRIPQACFGADAGTLVATVATETAAGAPADEVESLLVKQG